jgi:hypothetical protein
MDSNLLIPLLLFGKASGRGSEVIKRTLPVALPGPPGQRFLLAALVADKDLKRQEQADKEKEQADKESIQEVINVDRITNESAFKDKLPKLHAVFLKLPAAVRESIVFPGDAGQPAGGSRKS